MAQSYDFIVVGGGNSGAVVASRLAASTSRPTVLLLEAGGNNVGLESMSGDERYQVAFKEGSEVNWGYKTEPQHGQPIDYSRGKGLGGSTAINFCGWVLGPRDDFDEWARQVDDDVFGWKNVQKCLKRVERLHNDVPEDFRQYIRPEKGDHGTAGRVDLSYQGSWKSSVKDAFEAARQTGYPVNPDVNSGDPIGIGIGPACVYNAVRVTATTSYLEKVPPNLTIRTKSLTSRILVTQGRAIGVETADAATFFATQDVILSCGAINTPQLLLLSGIGSKAEIERHGIKSVADLPHVGRNLRDHCFSTAGIVLKGPSISPNSQQTPSPMGWFKSSSVYTSEEFRQLPVATRSYLQRATVPTWEMATHTPFLDGTALGPNEEIFSAIALIMNPQSSGTVTLGSKNALDAPLIDPKFLSHPFDRKVAVEAMRDMIRFFEAPVFAAKTIRNAGWPKNSSEAAILDHFKTSLHSSWHMSSTVRMGKDASDSCVDSSFRVHGIKALRVVDLSVCPFVPNNHTQSTAYLLGEIAADKIIAEHSLGMREARI